MLCAKLGTENPRLEDLKLIALAPREGERPNFQFFRVWDLQDPSGYYQSVVVPRQERALNRLLHRQLHDVSAKERKDAVRKTAGPDEEPPLTRSPGRHRSLHRLPRQTPQSLPEREMGSERQGSNPPRPFLEGSVLHRRR